MSQTELGRLTDELNRQIQIFEDELNALELGVETSIKFEGASTRLEFNKVGKTFKLQVRDLGLKGDEVSDLRNCARETRLHAVQLFSGLFSGLLLAEDKEHGRVIKATEVVKKAIESVRTSGVCHEHLP